MHACRGTAAGGAPGLGVGQAAPQYSGYLGYCADFHVHHCVLVPPGAAAELCELPQWFVLHLRSQWEVELMCYYWRLFKGTKVFEAQGRHERNIQIFVMRTLKNGVLSCAVCLPALLHEGGLSSPSLWSLGSVPAVNAHVAQQHTHSLHLLQLCCPAGH